MIRIDGRLATYVELWFNEELPSTVAADVVMFNQRPAPVDDARSSVFLTLVNDISIDEAQVMAGFGHTNRYKINRAETKDGLRADFMTDSLRYLDEFCHFYDAFARQKSVQNSYRRGLAAAAAAHQLVLTSASCNGERLVWHAYVMYGKRTALRYSASHFRGRERHDRALLGRANRWLHWRDMMSFKRMGFEHYDWGGLFEDESAAERAGINNFKREFGGRLERTYDCTLPLSLKGRLYLLLRETLDRLNHR